MGTPFRERPACPQQPHTKSLGGPGAAGDAPQTRVSLAGRHQEEVCGAALPVTAGSEINDRCLQHFHIHCFDLREGFDVLSYFYLNLLVWPGKQSSLNYHVLRELTLLEPSEVARRPVPPLGAGAGASRGHRRAPSCAQGPDPRAGNQAARATARWVRTARAPRLRGGCGGGSGEDGTGGPGSTGDAVGAPGPLRGPPVRLHLPSCAPGVLAAGFSLRAGGALGALQRPCRWKRYYTSRSLSSKGCDIIKSN